MKLLGAFSVADLLWAASLLGQIVIFIWIAPLRKAQARVTKLEHEVSKLNLDKIKAEMAETHVARPHCTVSMDNVADEIAQIQADRRESVKALHTKIDLLAATLNRNFQDMERAIGRLEGRVQ